MSGRRILTSSIRSEVSTWKPLLTPRPWSSSASFPRTISSAFVKLPSPAAPQHPNKTKVSTNGAHQRFFQSRGFSQTPLPLSSKLLAALGVFLGIGSGAAFHSMNDKDSTFEEHFLVACAENSENENCDCEKPKEPPVCVEKPKCKPKKCQDSPCLRKMECEEEVIMKANADLELALMDTKVKAVEYTESAMKAYCDAIDIICEFLNNAYCIIDDDEMVTPQYEETWCCLYNIAKKRCEKVRDAIQKGHCAWALLRRLRDILENGKACKYTSCNPLLVTVEDFLGCAEQELTTLKARMDCVATDHEMVAQFKAVIENFRSDLKSDVSEQIAGMKCCNIEFPEQEMAMMIVEAYKKVVRAHKALAQNLVCGGKIPERMTNTCC